MNWLRLLASVVIAGYAAYSDVRTREVNDLVWVALCLVSLPFLIPEVMGMERGLLIVYLLSLYVAFVAGLIVAAFKLAGWADFLALLAFSLVTPPKWGAPLSTLPSLSILVNALLLSCAYPLYILSSNISVKLQGNRIFDEIEADRLTKAVALFACRRVRVEEYSRKKNFYTVVERSEGGRKCLELRLGAVEVDYQPEGPYVWVTPHIPFVAFLTLGYLLHIIHGCLLDLFFVR